MSRYQRNKLAHCAFCGEGGRWRQIGNRRELPTGWTQNPPGAGVTCRRRDCRATAKDLLGRHAAAKTEPRKHGGTDR